MFVAIICLEFQHLLANAVCAVESWVVLGDGTSCILSKVAISQLSALLQGLLAA